MNRTAPQWCSRCDGTAPRPTGTCPECGCEPPAVNVQRYRKKPVEIEAYQWMGHNFDVLSLWCGEMIHQRPDDSVMLFVAANTAWLDIIVTEWVARDRHGFYPDQGRRVHRDIRAGQARSLMCWPLGHRWASHASYFHCLKCGAIKRYPTNGGG